MSRLSEILLLLVSFAFAPSAALAGGAIAVDDEVGLSAKDVGYGIGRGDTKAQVEADAVREYLAHGNKRCEVIVTDNQCGAVVVSAKRIFGAFGPSEGEAVAAAMQQCGGKCELVVADCD